MGWTTTHLCTSIGGYRWLESYIHTLSASGIVFLSVLAGIALVATLLSGKWYSALALRMASRHISDIRRTAIPALGSYIPVVLLFFLFPLCALFSDNGNSWWVFMLSGWLASALTAYYAIGIRRISAAVIYAGGKYFISRRYGLWGWKAADEIKCLTAIRQEHLGTTLYRLTYLDRKGRFKIYGYLPISEFPDEAGSLILDFARSFHN